jgi:hypothetical protein
MQGSLFGRVALTRDQIVENVLAGRPSTCEGYDLAFADEGVRLGAPLVRELRDLAPERLSEGLAARTLIVDVSKQPQAAPSRPVAEHAELLARRGVPCQVEVAVEPTLPWVHERWFAARFPDLFGKTFRWLGL